MGFTMANRAFEEVFGEGRRESGQVYADFMKMLKEYLHNEKSPSARKMAEWINRDGQLFSFTCRQDAVETLCDNMTAAHIPYIIVNETSGKMGFLVRDPDVEAVRKITKKTLAQMSHYCSISNGEDTGFSYLKGKDEDKTMLMIAGLDRDEAFLFAETAKDVLPGEKIGIDRMPDNTYMLTVHAKTAMKKVKKKGYFPGALAEIVVMANGESRKDTRKKVTERLSYIGEKETGFPGKDGASPVWVVGGGNCFVKKTEEGAEAGHAVVIDNRVMLETDYTIKKDDRRYKARLNSALSRITDHKCLYNIQDVIEHFRNPGRFMKGKKIKGQEEFIRKAAELVAQKVSTERLTRMDGKWEHKFRHFQKEMKRVIEGAALGRVPKGYSRADIISLREMAAAYGLQMQFMLPGIKKYAELDSYAREAGKQRVADLEQLIANFGGGQQEERDVSKIQESPGDRNVVETR